MPELADVEGFKRYFARYAAGKRVERVSVLDEGVLRNTTPQGLGRALSGHTLGEPARTGKWLLVPVDSSTLVVHFGMTGDLAWTGSPEDDYEDMTRVVFDLDGGQLRYRSQRKFGGLWLASGPDDLDEITGHPGPDALSITRDAFHERFDHKRGAIKPALMDQETMAGLGNELSDEILWRAKVHPATKIPALGHEGLDTLFDAMRDVLKESVKHGRIPKEGRWLNRVRTEDDPSCPRCGATIQASKVGGRTSYWCPQCQPKPRGGKP